MPRPTNSVPSYLHHKTSGRAYCVIRRADGSRQQVYLGLFGSRESREEYARVLAGHVAPETCDAANPSMPAPRSLTVTELIVRFLAHAEAYYRRADGTPTGEFNDYRLSLRPLRFLFGELAVTEFGPLALQRVRDLMISGYDHPDYGRQSNLSRKVINQRIDRIKRAFRWGVSQELVSPAVYQGLTSVCGLQAGRSEARETEAVEPVSREAVEKTLALLHPVLCAMVRVQLLTGMRPGEVCALRAENIDRTGPVWLYRPAQHKTAHRGKARVIFIGPGAQAVLAPFLDQPEFLFSPAHAVELLNAARQAARKSKPTPSQRARRRKKAPKRRPGDRYTIQAYQHAIRRAAARAGVGHWHPNQLRHTYGSEVRRRFGLEAAQVALGHSHAAVTQVYAERDERLGLEVARDIG